MQFCHLSSVPLLSDLCHITSWCHRSTCKKVFQVDDHPQRSQLSVSSTNDCRASCNMTKELELSLSVLSVIVSHVGSGVERIDLFRFLAGCRKSQLNQALSVLSITLGFFLSVSIVLLSRATFCIVLFCVIYMFCLLVVLVILVSVLVL